MLNSALHNFVPVVLKSPFTVQLDLDSGRDILFIPLREQSLNPEFKEGTVRLFLSFNSSSQIYSCIPKTEICQKIVVSLMREESRGWNIQRLQVTSNSGSSLPLVLPI